MKFQGPPGPPSESYTSPWDIRVPWDLQIHMQVYEISGSPATAFKLICRPMSFGISQTLFQIYAQVHMIFQGPWDLCQIYERVPEVSGSLSLSFSFLCKGQ